MTKLPLVLKGIMTVEDALLGVKYGANAILVSNHGARQIDGTPATVFVFIVYDYSNIPFHPELFLLMKSIFSSIIVF